MIEYYIETDWEYNDSQTYNYNKFLETYQVRTNVIPGYLVEEDCEAWDSSVATYDSSVSTFYDDYESFVQEWIDQCQNWIAINWPQDPPVTEKSYDPGLVPTQPTAPDDFDGY